MLFVYRLRAWLPAALCAVAGGLPPAQRAVAQAAAAAAPSASAAATDLSASERAQRDADKVFRWILIHSDKPRKAAPAKEEKPAVAARPKPAPRVGAKPDEAPAPAPTAAAKRADPPPVPAMAAKRTESAPAPAVATANVAPAAAPASAPSVEAAPVAVATAAAAAPPPSGDVPGDERLVPISRVDPKYPAALLRILRSGKVQVRFTVQPDGSVIEPKVESSSNARLNPPALAAVSQWRFAPLRKAQSGIVDLVFSLE